MESDRSAAFVTVNVYDISVHNSWLSVFGLGVYHTGVEVYGKEYSFGGHSVENRSGIYSLPPKKGPTFPYIKLRESIQLGQCLLDKDEVSQIIRQMAKTWIGPSYHLLTKNCNHFTNEFCRIVLNGKVSASVEQRYRWVNRLADIGNSVPWIIPQAWLETPEPFDLPAPAPACGVRKQSLSRRLSRIYKREPKSAIPALTAQPECKLLPSEALESSTDPAPITSKEAPKDAGSSRVDQLDGAESSNVSEDSNDLCLGSDKHALAFIDCPADDDISRVTGEIPYPLLNASDCNADSSRFSRSTVSTHKLGANISSIDQKSAGESISKDQRAQKVLAKLHINQRAVNGDDEESSEEFSKGCTVMPESLKPTPHTPKSSASIASWLRSPLSALFGNRKGHQNFTDIASLNREQTLPTESKRLVGDKFFGR